MLRALSASLANLRVGVRLGFAFGIVLLGTLLMAAAALHAQQTQSQAVAQALDVHVRYVVSVLRVRTQLANMRRAEKDMIINTAHVDEVKRHWDGWQAANGRLTENIRRANAVAPDAVTRKRLERLTNAIDSYRSNMSGLFGRIESRVLTTADEAYSKVDAFRGDLAEADAAMTELFDTSMKNLEESRAELGAVQERTRAQLLWILAAVVLVAVVLAVVTARSITRPIGNAVKVSEALARGDLTHVFEVHGRDELGQLMGSLKRTVEQLNRIASEIRRASDAVGSAAQEIAQGHADLSSRTEQQASSLEETAASMEQMTATVSQNAQNARKASKRASEASAVAERGGQAVAMVVSTMGGISESSKKIADITGVIDGIAFQTNILALNAAVEAARAGEQGRGFAVVASEVRSLAQRSAAAAKEIRQLISDSVGRIDQGSRQVEHAGETMAEIVGTVRRVNKRIAEISAASQEQSQSIAQVSDTVQQLEKVTQQNAAMVEQATAASASLKEQAASLTRAVGSFKLAEGGKAGAGPAPAPGAKPASAKQAVLQPAPASKVAREAPRALPKQAPKPGKVKEEGWEEF